MLDFGSSLVILLFIVAMFINSILLVAFVIRPSLRTSLNIFLSSLIVLNIIKLSLEIVAR